MLSTEKKVIFILVFFSFSTLFLSCTPNEPLSPDAQAFKDQMVEDFNQLKSGLIPALEKDKPVMAASEVIEYFLLELKENDRRIFGIGLLDKSGEYLTGFVVDSTNKGNLIKDKYKDMNFHSFEVVEEIVNSRKVMQEKLYLQDAGILAIGFPLVNEGELRGILCFTFKSYEFEKRWGISVKEFLEIDFEKV